MMEKIELLTKLFKEIGIELTNYQCKQFQQYYEMIIERNKVMNLTSITEYKEVLVKHFIDSLSIIRVIDFNKNLKVIDVGTGAGFPGIPLKIIFPHLELVLLDSLNKRIKFLDDVIDELELNNKEFGSIKTIHGRAEDFGQNHDYREKFDLSVSRAVANLSTLSEYCLPFVKTGGFFVSYKAGNIEDEVKDAKNSVKTLGGEFLEINSFQLPLSDIDRNLIKIRKKSKTPKKFPRNPGKVKNNPII